MERNVWFSLIPANLLHLKCVFKVVKPFVFKIIEQSLHSMNFCPNKSHAIIISNTIVKDDRSFRTTSYCWVELGQVAPSQSAHFYLQFEYTVFHRTFSQFAAVQHPIAIQNYFDNLKILSTKVHRNFSF